MGRNADKIEVTKELILGRYRYKHGKENFLGEGSFSMVRKGVDEKTGKEVAIKSYKLENIKPDSKEMEITMLKYKRQIKVLNKLAEDISEEQLKTIDPRLRHPSFPKLKCSQLFLSLEDYSRMKDGTPGPSEDGTMYVINEILDYSLKDYTDSLAEQKMTIAPEVVKQICNNFILCVALLHAKGYAHLDLKPENIMRGGGVWKLIDVDGCVPLNKEVAMDDQTISFSPCYCAPEWADFMLASGSKKLMVRDALDVWSVGLSLCELIILDAALKPKFCQLLRNVGSQRKALFLFMQWLSDPKEKLVLDKKIGDYDREFIDLVLRQMLVKDKSRRMTLAECLTHPFVKEVKIAALEAGYQHDDKESKIAAAALKKRNQRAEEADTGKPPLFKGTLWKLNADGDAMNKEHWLKRDMWLAADGNLCYFSQKKGKRLVLMPHTDMMRCQIIKMKASESNQEYAFKISPKKDGKNDDEAALAEEEADTQYYACESDEELNQWVEMLGKACELEQIDGKMQMSMGLMEDFKNFKIEVKNRREKFEKTKGFESAYKCELWKLNQEGDLNNPEHWLKREMWIAKNGAFCYYSKKEGRELQYYKSTDIRYVKCDIIDDSEVCKPHAFTLQLPPSNGLEYAPGVFAAMTAQERDNFLYTVKKFQHARAQHDAAMKAKREAEKAKAAAAK